MTKTPHRVLLLASLAVLLGLPGGAVAASADPRAPTKEEPLPVALRGARHPPALRGDSPSLRVLTGGGGGGLLRGMAARAAAASGRLAGAGLPGRGDPRLGPCRARGGGRAGRGLGEPPAVRGLHHPPPCRVAVVPRPEGAHRLPLHQRAPGLLGALRGGRPGPGVRLQGVLGEEWAGGWLARHVPRVPGSGLHLRGDAVVDAGKQRPRREDVRPGTSSCSGAARGTRCWCWTWRATRRASGWRCSARASSRRRTSTSSRRARRRALVLPGGRGSGHALLEALPLVLAAPALGPLPAPAHRGRRPGHSSHRSSPARRHRRARCRRAALGVLTLAPVLLGGSRLAGLLRGDRLGSAALGLLLEAQERLDEVVVAVRRGSCRCPRPWA